MEINWIRYYPLFQPHEFECRCGCGKMNISPALIDKLYIARNMAGVPFDINSGCRCEEHNRKVTQSEDSAHPDGLAVDIRAVLMSRRHLILSSLYSVGFPRIGLNRRFFHVDICSRRPQGTFFY